MRRLLYSLFTLLLIVQVAAGQKNPGYTYTIDLTVVKDDKVQVEVLLPKVTTPEVTFYLPKIVPGTYDIADYGRFISELKAFDKKGKVLPVVQKETNGWVISNATSLHKITYWVEDTYDTEKGEPEIFQPAGTNIEEGNNFLINTGGFLGYLDGQKQVPFRIQVLRPENFYGSTGLIPVQTNMSLSALKLERKTKTNGKIDVYTTRDYDQLIDSPLMYAKADTAVIKVGNTEVLIGSYSPNKKISAKEIAGSIREVLQAQRSFLGGTLPVDKYAFIFYFTDKPVLSYGALEHSYSSLYYMPEASITDMEQQLRDFAAHEFFHIVTPLTIHSEEIQFFDFNKPKMSKHLWLYEGVTEYFAGNVQVQYGLISEDDYLNVLREKMTTADQFKDNVPFTEISAQTLDTYHDQYYNVYMKGSLIAMCLDLTLLNKTNGKYGVVELMKDLSKTYGKQKPFKDDELFAEITKLTFPEIKTFFDNYVQGPEKLPLGEVLKLAGVNYQADGKMQSYSLGIGNENLGVIEVEGKRKLQMVNINNLNAVGVALGFQPGDVLEAINGKTMPDLGPSLAQFVQQEFEMLPTSKTLSFTVLRKEGEKYISHVLTAPVQPIEMQVRHLISFEDNPTAEQLALRKAWLKAN